jgi:hypothetical protein
MKARLRKALVLAAGCSLVLAFLGQGFAFTGANSQTFDEAVYLAAGYSHLKTGDFRLSPEHPPLTRLLAALPLYLTDNIPFAPDPHLWEEGEEWQIGRDFLYASPVPHERLLALGRLPNLFLGAVLVGLVGWWAYRLWGEWPALVAMALAGVDPNLVAHAGVITPDLGLTLFSLLTVYLLWEYLTAPSRRLLAAVGVSLGCALATKFSALFLVGIVGVVLGLHALRGRPPRADGRPEPQGEGARRRLATAQVAGRRILLCAFLTLPLFYFIHGFPLWGAGLRAQLDRPPTHAFFLGEQGAQGWWAYFPVAFLIKTPVGTLLLLLASLLTFRAGKRLGWNEALFLLVPPALFFLAMAAGRVNNGLRQVLPVYPFLFVAASRVVTVRLLPGAAGGWLTAGLVSLALVVNAGSSLKVAPHQLAYFNELVGGPGEGHRYLIDSNLDWGQDLKGLKAYVEREGLPMIYLSYFGTARPASYGIRYQRLPGFFDPLQQPPDDLLPPGMAREILAISVTTLEGMYLRDRDLYRWLGQRTPVDRIGESIYVYDLTGDGDAHLRLAEVYRRAGLWTCAAAEYQKGGGTRPADFTTGARPPP